MDTSTLFIRLLVFFRASYYWIGATRQPQEEAPTNITALKAARKKVYVNAVYIAN